MSNPLLEFTGLPPFSQIEPEHVEPAVDALLAGNRERIEALLASDAPRTWDSLVQPVEDMNERLERAWAPVEHLNSVTNSDALRAAYNACLPKLSAYASEFGQNRALYEAWHTVAAGGSVLEPAQRRILEHDLRDFRLAGVDLDEPGRSRFREIQQRLSSLGAKFEENVLDATQSWSLRVTDESRLSGLPSHLLESLRDDDGWVFTLDHPVYHAVLTHADDRALRETLHHAWVTRAAPGGPHADRYDNSGIMREILALRHEAARLLGFGNYAELSLQTKMAPDTGTVLGFLEDLAARSRPSAESDISTLRAWAAGHAGLDPLEPWDIAWVAEKLRQERFALSQEALRPYFPAPRVVDGMFRVVERLFGVQVHEAAAPDSWHPDVRFYELLDDDGALRGQFYLDLYTRKGKRGGAWMGACRSRRRCGDRVEVPVAWLVCNFSPPSSGRPSLLTHDDVTTLFHEFGHGLHHMLTRIDYPSVAGINGVEWDAVELPSQFLENWCWERDALDLIAAHWESGEPLPGEMFDRMTSARHFLAGLDMLRQLEFALFDFRLHLEREPDIARLLEEVRAQASVVPVAPYNRFQNSFTHIFGGGYAAGYYSYKWAEVLAADAFGAFREHGVFDRATGIRFLQSILEQGSVRDAMEMFIDFRGREPDADALLQQYGIAA